MKTFRTNAESATTFFWLIFFLMGPYIFFETFKMHGFVLLKIIVTRTVSWFKHRNSRQLAHSNSIEAVRHALNFSWNTKIELSESSGVDVCIL